MSNDTNCPFCYCREVKFAFERVGKRFGFCPECRAYIWLDAKSLVDDPYADGDFVSRIQELLETSPNSSAFQYYCSYLVPGSVLEIGPGTGDFLAAARSAGYHVTGVELSPSNREYIRKRWGIETLAEPLEDNPPAENQYDNVVSINCIEHVLKPEEHFRAVCKVLKPGGRFIVSTCNSESLEAHLSGRWWTMLKALDHINLVSLKGLNALGKRVGLEVLKEWSSEYPLQTAITVGASIRDWLQSGKESTLPGKSTGLTERSQSRRIARYLMNNRLFSLFGMTISWFGLGGSIKVVFQKPRLR